MKSRLLPKLNYANVIATVALFVALGGAAVAAGLPKNSVGPNQIKRGAVNAAKLKKNAVNSAKLAPKSVIAGKLGPNAVTPGNIGNGAITSAKLAANSVLATAIKNGVITTAKLQNELVNSSKLGKGSVTLSKLSDEVTPLLGSLRSGQTLRGVFYLGGSDPAAADISRSAISYQFPLGGNPPSVAVLKKGTTSANCAGLGSGSAPSATGGNLCIYLTEETNLDETIPLEAANNTRLGFGLTAKSKEPGNYVAAGQWAVTAP